MAHLGRGEEVGRAVGAGGHACPAPDARRGVEGDVGDRFRDRDLVGLWGRAGVDRDEPAGLDDPVERGTVHHQVPDQREPGGPPGLDRDRRPVLELPHVQLAGGGAGLRTVRLAIDHHAAAATDPLPAVMVEGDRLLALGEKPLIEDVEHLEERHLLGDAVDLIGLEPSRRIGPDLSPDLENEVHL